MAIKLKHSDIYSTYFITFTCIEWITLFDITNGYDIAYNWFSVLKKENNADVVAYVLMPNHQGQVQKIFKDSFDAKPIVGARL